MVTCKEIEYEISNNQLTILCDVEFYAHYERNPWDKYTPPYHGEDNGFELDNLIINSAVVTDNNGNFTLYKDMDKLIARIGAEEFQKLKQFCEDKYE